MKQLLAVLLLLPLTACSDSNASVGICETVAVDFLADDPQEARRQCLLQISLADQIFGVEAATIHEGEAIVFLKRGDQEQVEIAAKYVCEGPIPLKTARVLFDKDAHVIRHCRT